MLTFPSLMTAGAAVACISSLDDGDCGWDGWSAGYRPAFLRRAGVIPEKLVALRQCHGERIVAVAPQDGGRGAADPAEALADADALITDARGIPLGITVADCVPVFLSGPGAVGLVHAGRAGTGLGIVGRAVSVLCRRYELDISTLFAVIGPSAGPCCYEVPEALRDRCVAGGMVARGTTLDLWESNRLQLLAAGVPGSQIAVAGHCTICGGGFHSYRAGHATARNLAVIMR